MLAVIRLFSRVPDGGSIKKGSLQALECQMAQIWFPILLFENVCKAFVF